ncbi:two-component system chemotaxis family CheB-CheR fusion protein [Salinisphaera shabanensis E1L3A]|uniref:Two-component system chemotaxis family CheB-CheR fusion protein n=1 Tax=Salinisphaera shabanensis E1L3A TaxID=1033802 RepID=F7Q8S8_9GAMM|nr:EAL domain-containing protein [Salinisphaera shabanensis]ERJ20102.1 two-component system chemotaxis family CheB-CheR fusion protein [Salinisphaera shabanensis E1L3A]
MIDSVPQLEALATGIAIINGDNVIVHANTAFARRLNVDALPYRLTDIDLPEARSRDLLEWQLRDIGESALTVAIAPGRSLTFYIGAQREGQRLIIAASGWPHRDESTRDLAAQLDPLTGFGNRLMYAERLREFEAMGTKAAAVLIIDLDHFKQVNDTLGHGTGDELLGLVAQRIRASTRGNDTLIRLGGDEFVVLIPEEKHCEGLEALAGRLVNLLGRPFLVNGHQINIGASIGVATLVGDSDQLQDLLRHADLALYEAKHRGRAGHYVFQSPLEQRAFDRREFEVDLRRALGLRQFTLHYQPQTSIADRRVTGFEALIRWEHPTRGRVSPLDFIPLAEEIGEIAAIGRWVIRCACEEAMAWQDERLSVAVNVSPAQFADDTIVDAVRDALDHSGLAPARLELEITEGLFLEESESIMRRLWAIKELGVAVAIDDFGTGYASLGYLNSFPFSKIKIDKSFIQAEPSPRAKALISGILAMGSNLGMATTAEGIETLEQYTQLEHDGCSLAQGYYIARPMPAGQIADFLERFCPPTARAS